MILAAPSDKRTLYTQTLAADLVVVGGGLAGVCCAVTAARSGIRVILVQDRPVLGGNSSSEVRLWILGATSHMGNNNRWAREGGVIDELLLENAWRNPDGNPLIFDTIILEKVVEESNITLLLNTTVYDLDKSDPDTISLVYAFCSQNSTSYQLHAPVYCDASGDGILGFLSGAAFRMGAESSEEFGEKFAPDKSYGELLGHTIYFYTKDLGRPVKFVPPSFALTDITRIPRYRQFNPRDFGCRLWWIEYGGRLDTVHDTERIKWELWKVVYGVWNYIKNSGNFPEAETMTLEWVGTIPGKRESRRFEGDYMLRQQDIVEQRNFPDAVAFGGWSIDLHPADGVFSEKPGCNQWHSKGIYSIPYRCYYSRNISNLFLAGRIISATHVAFGSTRVMATSAYGGQAVGVAAGLCHKYQILPREVGEVHLNELQLELQRLGQHIPNRQLADPLDLVRRARQITASSTLAFTGFPSAGIWRRLDTAAGQMLPVLPGMALPPLSIELEADYPLTYTVELRKSSKPYNHTPDVVLETITLQLNVGRQQLELHFKTAFEEACYAFVLFPREDALQLSYSDRRVSGILSVFNRINPAVSNYGKQTPTEDIGVDSFEFWCPERRPGGQNIALQWEQPLPVFDPENLRNGLQRPVASPNAWVAAFDDRQPMISIQWDEPVSLNRIELAFDTDFDHPLENVLLRNPEMVMPFCATEVEVLNCNNEVVATLRENYLSRRSIRLENLLTVRELKIRLKNADPLTPVSLFEVRCYCD